MPDNQRVSQAFQRAGGVHQRADGGLMVGIGSRGGNPHLPQLPRFGMNVAKRGFNVPGMFNFKWLRVAEMAHPTTGARFIGRSAFSDMT